LFLLPFSGTACSKMSMYRYLLYTGLSKAEVEHNLKDHVSDPYNAA